MSSSDGRQGSDGSAAVGEVVSLIAQRNERVDRRCAQAFE
jgi:hypothetical protein